VRALRDRLDSFWSEERSLTAVLVSLLLLLLLPGPGKGANEILSVASSLLLTALLLSGVLALTRHRAFRFLCWAVVLTALGTRWLYATGEFPFLLGPSLLLTLLSLLFIGWMVILQLSREGPVTAHRVRGAVALYLLVGAVFAYAFSFLLSMRPGAFHMPAWWSPAMSRRPEAFFYFSIVTLTTLGFGDITPVDGTARDLVMIEALIGQLYPAITIARLVTLQLSTGRAPTGKPNAPDGYRRDDGEEVSPKRIPAGSGKQAERDIDRHTDN
jgi:hypothetical protein